MEGFDFSGMHPENMNPDMPEQYMCPPDLSAFLLPQPNFDPFNLGFKREDIFDQQQFPPPYDMEGMDPTMLFMADGIHQDPEMQKYLQNPFDFFSMLQMPQIEEDKGDYKPVYPTQNDIKLSNQNIIPFPYTRKIGTLSIEERRLKIQQFREKRKRRNFRKRIAYTCRKRVADSRLRIKGRFITKEQASQLETTNEN